MPCGGPPARPCSSVSWSVTGQFGSVSAVADAGSVTPPYRLRFGLLQDCSLKIINLSLDDARTYWCHSNGMNSSVSLHIVEREGNILLPKDIFGKADNDVISLIDSTSYREPPTSRWHHRASVLPKHLPGTQTVFYQRYSHPVEDGARHAAPWGEDSHGKSL